MRHAKRDGVLKSGEDGSVRAEIDAAFAQRELEIGLEQANRRDFNAARAEGFELQLLLIRGDGDVADGFVGGEAGWGIEAGAAESVYKFCRRQTLGDCRDVSVAGIGDGAFGVEFS